MGKCHLGGKPDQSRLSTPFHIVEKMIETKEPEEIDSQTRKISVLDSEGNNGNWTSACVTHSPWNISNSQASLLASSALEDLWRRESLRHVDLMVRLDNITILHKLNHAVQRSSPQTNTILRGYKNINIHLGGKPDQSRLSTPFHIVEKMIETKEPEEIDSQTRRISILDSEGNN